MPNFPITDTHVHLVDPGRIRYSWLDSAPALNRPWLLGDYNKATESVEIGKIVFMEVCPDYHEIYNEVAWITELAQSDPRIQGIIANARFEESDTIEAVLETHANSPLVRSIRRVTQELDIDFCIQPEFIEGVRLLSKHGLLCDICIVHPQLPNTIKLVDACPDVRFVLDHIGKPDIKNQVFDPWKADIKSLAERENVICKISGIVTEADHANWTPEDVEPYILHVIDCFGFDRVVYGGDWFVMTLAAEYPQWIEVIDRTLEGCSETDLRKFYVENADRVYGLGSGGR
jgi:L-fuconolactonase